MRLPFVVLCVIFATGAPASEQPTVAVLNLKFDGSHANVLEASDTAVVAAATGRLRAGLAESGRVALLDSAAVAAAVAAREADGNACDNACALAVGRDLGARWVVKGTVSKTSNIVWILSATLLDAATGATVLSDSYELKGDATRMAPAGAHAFAQRVEHRIAPVN